MAEEVQFTDKERDEEIIDLIQATKLLLNHSVSMERRLELLEMVSGSMCNLIYDELPKILTPEQKKEFEKIKSKNLIEQGKRKEELEKEWAKEDKEME